MIEGVLVNGRTSRLYKTLVEEQQLALDVGGYSGFPGDKYPNMLILFAVNAPGVAHDQIGETIHREHDRLKTEPVTPQELDRVRTQARANLLRELDSNSGMAALLAAYEAKTGSWRNIFAELEAIEAVTPEDIQRVAQTTFRPENRTVGKLMSME
jgi:predicted Zn-dependent peptidase